MELASIIAGIGLVIFNKAFARNVIKSQNRAWGFHFGKRDEQFTCVLAVLIGIGFTTFGILAIAHVLPMKE